MKYNPCKICLGDKIKLKQTGGFYASYRRAYEFMGGKIMSSSEIYYMKLDEVVWTVTNMAIHDFSNEYVYLLKYKNVDVVYDLNDKKYFTKVELPKPIQEHNERITKNFKVRKIGCDV